MSEHPRKVRYAEDLSYWKTGASRAPDAWLEMAKAKIRKVGGKLLGNATISANGQAAFMIAFELDDEQFKITWPVIQPRWDKEKNELASMRQSATALYHDINAKCVTYQFIGARLAFFAYKVLPGGEVAGELADDRLLECATKMKLLLPA